MIAGGSLRAPLRAIAPGAWESRQLSVVPAAWRGRVADIHAEKLAEDMRAGNLWLLSLAEGFKKIRVPVNLTDAELIDYANQRAAEAMGKAEVAPGVYLSEPGALRRRLEAYCETYGVRAPAPFRWGPYRRGAYTGVTDRGAIARMCCPIWWRRRLRQGQARALEGKAIELRYVHKRGEIYASDATVERRLHQKARNAAGLEATEAINRDTGEVYTLAALAAASVANPRIRRGELMTRIAGFEAIAQGVGDAAEFITITAPSKFHAMKIGEGGRPEENPRYAGATPRETQQYMARTWANIRAKLHRMGIAPYGFRIAEPHHDGTPHWHMLLFVGRWLRNRILPKEALRSAVSRLRAIIRRYALKVDGAEPGAKKNRCEFVAIDWSRGSAAGYVAKYVSKNIDGGGYQVQGDTEGGPGDIFPGHRVEAWASTWGIRQFQQVGGPPVGVWRELRRLEASADHPPVIAAARSAADCGRNGHDESGAAGNWRRYVEVMGGPVMRRADRPIGVAYTRPGEVWRYTLQGAEPAPPTRYGETRPGSVYGVLHKASGRAIASVRFAWEIRKGQQATGRNSRGKDAAAEHSGPLGSEGGALYRHGQQPGAEMPPGFDFDSPWSPVNNCSRQSEKGAANERSESGGSGIGGGERQDRRGGLDVDGLGDSPGLSGRQGARSSCGLHDAGGGQESCPGIGGAGQAAGFRGRIEGG